MHKIGINFDEISDNLGEAIRVMHQANIVLGELRTIEGKNFVFWSDEEVKEFKRSLTVGGIELVAAATPLFKWYVSTSDHDVPHDSFGFNPRLKDAEKKAVIQRTFEIAKMLEIPRLRIFSGLGESKNAANEFANDPLLEYILDLATQNEIDLCIENEPVCRIHSKEDIVQVLRLRQHPRLKLWLDIANLTQLKEQVDKDFLKKVADRLSYVHIKDYIVQNNEFHYVPVGNGIVPYKQIITLLMETCPKNLIYTVETHAKSGKIDSSVVSLKNLKKIFEEMGV